MKYKIIVLALFLGLLSLPASAFAQTASMTYPINKNVNWHNNQVTATSVTETYSYNAAGDILTINFGFNQTGLAALPPMMALAKQYGFPINCSTSDTGFKSIFGPLVGIANSSSLSCTISGLKKYTAFKSLGTGTVPTNIVSEINTQVDKITAAGHFTPELLGPTMPGSDSFDPKGYFLWYSPGDVHYFLSEVYPLLDSSRQQAVTTYLTNERNNYKPETIKALPFWTTTWDGVNRNPYRTSSQVYGWWWPNEPDQGNTTWVAQAYFKVAGNPTIPNLYGLSRYYQTTNQTPTSANITAFTTIVQNQYQNADWATLYWKNGSWPEFNAVSSVNQLFAGLVGFTRMAEKANNTQAINLGYGLLARMASLRVAMGKYQQYQITRGAVSLSSNPMSATQRDIDNENGFAYYGDLFTYNLDSAIKDIRQIHILDNTQVGVGNWSGTGAGVFENGGGTSNTAQVKSLPASDALGWASSKGPQLVAFADITPELGRLLKDYLPQETAQLTAIYVETQPLWYIAYQDQVIGIESNYANPMDAWGNFMARTWVNQESASQLEKYIDQPWFDRGDYFYLHKLSETAKAYKGWGWSDEGSLPTATSTPSVTPGDANGDGRVDGSDYVIWLVNFGKQFIGHTFGDFNNNGIIDGIDYVIWLNHYQL